MGWMMKGKKMVSVVELEERQSEVLAALPHLEGWPYAEKLVLWW